MLFSACLSGEGVPFNPALAAALVRTAAERGDPEAQAEHGFRLALGIYPPDPGRRCQLYSHKERLVQNRRT